MMADKDEVQLTKADVYILAHREAEQRNLDEDTNEWDTYKILDEWDEDIGEWEAYWSRTLNSEEIS